MVDDYSAFVAIPDMLISKSLLPWMTIVNGAEIWKIVAIGMLLQQWIHVCLGVPAA